MDSFETFDPGISPEDMANARLMRQQNMLSAAYGGLQAPLESAIAYQQLQIDNVQKALKSAMTRRVNSQAKLLVPSTDQLDRVLASRSDEQSVMLANAQSIASTVSPVQSSRSGPPLSSPLIITGKWCLWYSCIHHATVAQMCMIGPSIIQSQRLVPIQGYSFDTQQQAVDFISAHKDVLDRMGEQACGNAIVTPPPPPIGPPPPPIGPPPPPIGPPPPPPPPPPPGTPTGWTVGYTCNPPPGFIAAWPTYYYNVGPFFPDGSPNAANNFTPIPDATFPDEATAEQWVKDNPEWLVANNVCQPALPPPPPGCCPPPPLDYWYSVVRHLCHCLAKKGIGRTPVDIDTPLAFMFGEATEQWEANARAFYGQLFIDAAASTSVEAMKQVLSAIYNG